MQRKQFALAFDNKTVPLFNSGMVKNVRVDPIYDLPESIQFSNINDKFSKKIAAKIVEVRSFVNRKGPFGNPVDFFCRYGAIHHLFWGPGDNGRSKLYGFNFMQWDKFEKKIYLAACEADPFDEELLDQLGGQRDKGVGFYTVAQACYYYSKLVPVADKEATAIYMYAAPRAFQKRVWHRYGFKISATLEKMLKHKTKEEKDREYYRLFLTGQGVRKFLNKYRINTDF